MTKRGTSWLRVLALGAAVSGLGGGCQTVPNPPFPEGGGFSALEEGEGLGAEGKRIAGAHAAYAMGVHHDLRKEWGEAAAAYGESLALDPGNEAAAVRKASALVAGGDARGGLEWGEAWLAERGEEKSPDMALWLAAAYAETEVWDRAEALSEGVARRNPDNEAAWLMLARARVRDDDGRVEEAVSVLEEGMEGKAGNCDLRKAAVRLLMADLEENPGEREAERRERIIGHLRAMDEAEPGDLETLDRLGALLLANGEDEEALQVYAKVERLMPEGATFGGTGPLARALRRLGDPARAAEVVERLRARGEADGELLRHLAEFRAGEGNLEAAEELYGEMLEKEPGNVMLWLLRAAVTEKNDPAKTCETLEKGLEANPGAPELLQALGTVKLATHRYVEADELLEAALEAYESRDGAVAGSGLYANRVLAALERRRTGRAAARLAEGMKAHPECLETVAVYGLCGAPGVKTNLLRTYQSFLTRVGRDAGTAERTAVWYAMARLQGALDQYDAAVASFEAGEAESGAPMPAAERWIYAVLLDQAGRRADCIRELETVVRELPNLHMALNYLAYSLALEGIRLEEADRLVRRALALDPGNPAYRDTLAWVLYRQGRIEDAWWLIQTVVEAYGEEESEEVREHFEAIRKAVEERGEGDGEDDALRIEAE